MTFKVAFTHGAFRTVQADFAAVDEKLIVFTRDGETVLTAIIDNTLFFEPISAETCRQEPRGGLLDK